MDTPGKLVVEACWHTMTLRVVGGDYEAQRAHYDWDGMKNLWEVPPEELISVAEGNGLTLVEPSP